jgi:hypothetical protein
MRINLWFVSWWMASCFLAVTALGVPQPQAKPKLKLTITPRIGVAAPPYFVIPARLRAYIEGPITEEWYCPRVEWHWSDGTVSVEESDCPPWEEGIEGETSWTRRVNLGQGLHVIAVKLIKGEKTLARTEVTIEVK